MVIIEMTGFGFGRIKFQSDVFNNLQRRRWERDELYRWPGQYSSKGGKTDGKIYNTNKKNMIFHNQQILNY
jgi:hypothetical protein